jgi:septal ring factor EnvC (AmiA/AmiB activator)
VAHHGTFGTLELARTLLDIEARKRAADYLSGEQIKDFFVALNYDVLQERASKFAVSRFQLVVDAEPRERVVSVEAQLEQMRAQLAQIQVENERLRSRVAEEQRRAARQTQQHDQLKATLDRMLEHLAERSRAADAAVAALVEKEAGRVCLYESFSGEVRDVTNEEILVAYETDDDVIEQCYRTSQFIGGLVPKKGDRIEAFVFVSQSAASRLAPGAEAEKRRSRPSRRVITDLHHEF